MTEPSARHPRTPDGRYFVVRGRLWRTSNPNIRQGERERLVRVLMAARRVVRDAAGEPAATACARRPWTLRRWRLGERGPVWWDDGAPDYNRHMARTTPYVAWFAALDGTERPKDSH